MDNTTIQNNNRVCRDCGKNVSLEYGVYQAIVSNRKPFSLYIPLAVELEEMGFENKPFFSRSQWVRKLGEEIEIWYIGRWTMIPICGERDHEEESIYPQYQQDIEALIRLFTKP